jgi:hypothetical protein
MTSGSDFNPTGASRRSPAGVARTQATERCANAAVHTFSGHRISTTHLKGGVTTSAGVATAPREVLAAAMRGDLIMPGVLGYGHARAAG